jgi:hypothetical protein
VGKDFDPAETQVEDRVVIFQAADFEDAIAMAEDEARAYCAETFRNPYGQKIRIRFLGALEAFNMFDPPTSGCEVFSSMVVAKSAVADEKIVAARLGKPDKRHWSKRKKFTDSEVLHALTEE